MFLGVIEEELRCCLDKGPRQHHCEAVIALVCESLRSSSSSKGIDLTSWLRRHCAYAACARSPRATIPAGTTKVITQPFCGRSRTLSCPPCASIAFLAIVR